MDGTAVDSLSNNVCQGNFILCCLATTPVPVEDCLDSYRWLLETANVSPSNIVFAGDSAGGGMILSVLGAAKKEGLPLPAGGKNFCRCSFLILYTMKM